MAEFKGTPGPWEVGYEGQPVVIQANLPDDATHWLIAPVDGMTLEEAEANAMVMAASPELLASLQVLVRGQREGWWGEGSGEMEEGELQQAEAAIAKALGQS